MPNPYGWGQNEPQIKPKDQGGDTIATFSQKVYNLFDSLFNMLNSYPWSVATQSDAGYMSALDKKKLDVIDIFVESGSTAASGLVPKPPTTPGTLKYLCEDATWKVPPFVPKGNSTVTITYDPQNVDDSYSTAFKANGVYYIISTFHLKSGLTTWTDYWIAHLDITGGTPLRTFFTLTSQSTGLSVPCVCEVDGNVTLMQKGVNFSNDWLWGVAVVPIDM